MATAHPHSDPVAHLREVLKELVLAIYSMDAVRIKRATNAADAAMVAFDQTVEPPPRDRCDSDWWVSLVEEIGLAIGLDLIPADRVHIPSREQIIEAVKAHVSSAPFGRLH